MTWVFVFLDYVVLFHFILWPTGSEWHWICFLDHPVTLHFIPWPIVCEWHWIYFSRPCGLIAFHPWPTGGEWHCIYFLDHVHFIPWPIGCEWHCICFLDHVVSFHFNPWWIACEWHCICFSWPCSLIAFHPMTNRLWVILAHFIFYHAHCISSHDQQDVSDTAIYSLPCSLIAFHPWPTASKWLYISIFFLYCVVSLHSIDSMVIRMWETLPFSPIEV